MTAIYFRNVYAHDRHGSEYTATVELKTVADHARPVLRAWLNFKSGASAGGRRVDLDEVTDDFIAIASQALQGLAPREVFADALQEMGLDDGLVGTVRGM